LVTPAFDLPPETIPAETLVFGAIQEVTHDTQATQGETICNPAVASAGFLCESFEYLKAQNPKRTTAQDRALQERTFYGKEKKSLAYVIAIMNIILHGIEAHNIIHKGNPDRSLAKFALN